MLDLEEEIEAAKETPTVTLRVNNDTKLELWIWTKEYERKPAYAGFADGLAGVEKSYLGWASSGNSTTGENPTDDVEE